MRKWKEIWEKRTDNFDKIDMSDEKAVFLELKRIDGFDVVGGISYDALIKQNKDIIDRLTKHDKIKSIFDLGCGCGANLYLMLNEGFDVGGMDYSNTQINIAKKVFKDKKMRELLCGEALSLPTDVKYDALVANSVFSYFSDDEYARTVLDKMIDKTTCSIGLIDIHDIDKREEFIKYRRKTVENYDEKYKNLQKHFYNRDFFIGWAKENNVTAEFCDSDVDGYWNNEFVFDVYFYR